MPAAKIVQVRSGSPSRRTSSSRLVSSSPVRYYIVVRYNEKMVNQKRSTGPAAGRQDSPNFATSCACLSASLGRQCRIAASSHNNIQLLLQIAGAPDKVAATIGDAAERLACAMTTLLSSAIGARRRAWYCASRPVRPPVCPFEADTQKKREARNSLYRSRACTERARCEANSSADQAESGT